MRELTNSQFVTYTFGRAECSYDIGEGKGILCEMGDVKSRASQPRLISASLRAVTTRPTYCLSFEGLSGSVSPEALETLR